MMLLYTLIPECVMLSYTFMCGCIVITGSALQRPQLYLFFCDRKYTRVRRVGTAKLSTSSGAAVLSRSVC